MKRVVFFTVVAIFSFAQRSRDDYRTAYRTWREADPNLERESVAGGMPIAQRADRMAAESAKCAAARKAFLDGVADDEGRQVFWLENVDPIGESTATAAKFDSQFVTAETAAVTRMIDTFTSDPDKGIQQVRQALARERIALDALGSAIALRKKSAGAANTSAAAMEQSRTKALEHSQAMLQGLKDASADTQREAAAWAEYYRKIGEGAQGVATPITEVPPGVASVTLNNPIPAPPSITPVPLVRYVGAWTFPQTDGIYHGAQPEFIDVLVQDENGHIKGTLLGRFKLPPGSSGDPILRFDFFGDLQPARNQVFSLVTSDGAKGKIELIPGTAFNLLEINFQTDSKAGKVRQADVVLVKK